MSFDKVYTFYQYPFTLGVSKAYLALLTPVLAGDNQHGVILSNLHRY
jgi:hypothetical protein